MRILLLPAVMLAFAASSSLAQTSAVPDAPKPEACRAIGPATAQFKGFDTPTPSRAGPTPEAMPALKVGEAYALSLAPALGVTYAKAPGKPPLDGRYAGLAAFSIDKEGTYSLAASAGAWVDVLSQGTVIDSINHHHVDCSSVRKAVDFPLKPGTYVLQLSASPAPEIVVMVVPTS